MKSFGLITLLITILTNPDLLADITPQPPEPGPSTRKRRRVVAECRNCGITCRTEGELQAHSCVSETNEDPTSPQNDNVTVKSSESNLNKHKIIECDLCATIIRSDKLDRHRGSRRCKIRCDLCGVRVAATDYDVHKESHVVNLKYHISDSQQSDPGVQLQDEEEDEIVDIYSTFQRLINTYHRFGKVMSTYNFKCSCFSNFELARLFKKVYREQKQAFRVNISIGLLLQNKETGEYGFYAASQNNQLLLDNHSIIRNISDERKLVDKLRGMDMVNKLTRPSTKWIFVRVTNVTFYVYVLPGVPIGSPKEFPDFLLKNKGLYSLITNKKRGNLYEDNKCLFRCIALHQGCKISGIDRMANKLLKEYCTKATIQNFDGVTLDQLEEVSRMFNIAINVYSQDENRTTDMIYRTTLSTETPMNLNLYEQHFSFIKDLEKYSSSYRCPKCDVFWKRSGSFHRHVASCDVGVKRIYKGGSFKIKNTIFEDLEENGVNIPSDLRIFPFRAVFDIECFMSPPKAVEDTANTTYSFEHQLASVSICSNVPKYKVPKCFVIDKNGPQKLTHDMVDYLLEISEQSTMLLRERFADYIPEINETYLKDKFEAYMQQLPVLSFNGARYDLKILKQELIPVLVMLDSIKFVIKKGSSYMAIATEELLFLDITNYIAPGFSYSKFLGAYGAKEQKSHFPYEWFNSVDKLDETDFPNYEAFYSSLKQKNVLEPDVEDKDQQRQEGLQCYNELKSMFDEKRWNVRQYLEFYNNQDTGPFIAALENLVRYYSDRNVDVFKEAMSVPGIAERLAFRSIKDDSFFTLFGGRNKDLFNLFKANCVGGPAIIFDRLQVSGITNIRHVEDGECCKRVYGYDANSLYLGCMSEDMPCGAYLRRRRENRFFREYPTGSSMIATEWLSYMEDKHCINIQHARSGGEKRLGERKIPVDGFCSATKTVLQFHGCEYHGCPTCYPNQRDDKTVGIGSWSYEDKYNKTQEITTYLRDLGYTVVEQWECAWKSQRKSITVQNKYMYPTEHKLRMTEKEILEAVTSDKLFGALEVDVSVPGSLKEYFSDLPPIFKNTTVHHEDIGEHMQQHLEAQGRTFPDTKYLIASMFGNKILLITPMIKWLIEKGVNISKVHQVVEFEPRRCFKDFSDKVSADRRAGDKDKTLNIVADTSKLIGNSVYGHSLMDKERHSSVKFCDLETASRNINNPYFRSVEELSEETFEVTMQKRKILFDLPIQMGYWVYQHAKLKMLIFMYDVLDRHMDRKKYCLLEMDTDSLYIALSTENLDDAVKTGMEESWAKVKTEVFPRIDTKENMMYDRRTPGLFKTEWTGDGFIGLNAKTYYCFNEKDDRKSKYSSKGINRQLKLTKEDYLEVLKTRQTPVQKNRGFIFRDKTMLTYEMEKRGLNYLYVKRKVMADGISTTYLDL